MTDLQKTETYLLTNEHPPGISPYPQTNKLTGLWLYFPPFALLAHKHSPPQTFNRLACSLLHLVFPELQFLFYSWINSFSDNSNFPQFTSLFRLTKSKWYLCPSVIWLYIYLCVYIYIYIYTHIIAIIYMWSY